MATLSAARNYFLDEKQDAPVNPRSQFGSLLSRHAIFVDQYAATFPNNNFGLPFQAALFLFHTPKLFSEPFYNPFLQTGNIGLANSQ